ncbi:hypothetical protein C0995_005745 [Termitomyces sp. Mi166|nr:hypothetical protein C0995_005745 [Termitomyces sp. Mi166\
MPSRPSRAPDGHSDTTISVEEFTALHESNQQLHSMMSELFATFSSILSTGTASPAIQMPPATTPNTGLQPSSSMFVPPIPGAGTPVPGAGSNGTSSASLSLHTQFSDVNMAVITAIIMHKFKAADLHKLDPTNHDKETAYTFNSATNHFEVSHRAAKEYKTPFSVIIPLQFYFEILMFHVNNAAATSAFFHYTAATSAFFHYTADLVKLIAEYE